MFDLVPSRSRGAVARRGGLMPSIWDRFDSFFDEALRDTFNDIFGDTHYKDADGNTVLLIEVPGFNKENLKVEVANGVMTIEGDRSIGEGEVHAGNATISRRMTVGEVQDVKAEIKDGILKVVLNYPRNEVKKVEVS